MIKNIKIESILNFLEVKGYDFQFTGEKTDVIEGVSTLFKYRKGTLTFLSSLNNLNDFMHFFEKDDILLCILHTSEDENDIFQNTIKVDKPKKVFFDLLEVFFDETNDESKTFITSNLHKQTKISSVSENASLGENVKIGVGCVIEGNVSIGDNTVIHHNVVIRSGTKLGKNCSVLSGTIIGESGFNPLKVSGHERRLLNHYGGVFISDNVYIGDNCNISKGTIENTVINKGVKINKQVVIAHNVVVGENTIFTAPTFVGGSVELGKNCHVAAVAIRNQCRIADDAILGLGSVVVKDVKSGETVIGNPAKPIGR